MMPTVDMRAGNDARKGLLGLSGLMIVLLCINGSIGWFGLRYVGLEHTRALDALSEIHALESAARDARVDFKIQVQEWKNVLLRGHDPADLATFLASFENHERMVQEALEGIRDHAGDIGTIRQNAQDLLGEHALLGQRYREALEGFVAGDLDSVRQVDRSIRGIDRGLTQGIDDLADKARGMSLAMDRQIREDAERLMTRVERLTTISTVFTVLMLILTLFLLRRKG